VSSLFHAYAVANMLIFPVAALAFGLYYAKREGKSRRFGIVLAVTATVLCLLLALIGEVLVFWGLVAFASLYLADAKNRSRVAWAIATLIFATPALLVLLVVPGLPPAPQSILWHGDGKSG
jgi:hypothetical protein